VFGNPTETNWPGWMKLKHASKIPINKKFNKSQLRDKFPIFPLTADDHLYLSEIGLDLLS
jgi:hypothetical protein